MGAALLFLSLFAGLAALTAEPHFGVDRGARGLVGLSRGPVLDGPMHAITHLGEAAGLVPLIGAASFLLWRPRRRWAVGLPLVMAGAGVLQLAAKWTVDRPRPNLAPWGYPSGHVLSLVVFLGLLVYLLYAAPMRRRWRQAGTGLAAGILATVAFSRLYLDVHWLSDLGGGFALGMAYLLFAIWLVETSRAWRTGPAPARSRSEPSEPVIAAGLQVGAESTAA
jgi:membrane-associated phospholipid phosphatase